MLRLRVTILESLTEKNSVFKLKGTPRLTLAFIDFELFSIDLTFMVSFVFCITSMC